jgi:hypothetical protein
LTTGSLKYLLLELMNTGTTKLLVAIQQMVDATAPEENSHRTPTVPAHQLEDLLRVVTVPATLAVEAVAVGAPHMGLAGELAAGAIAEAEAMQTATSPAYQAAATMPAAELKKYSARSPPRQETVMVSSPSPLDFATCFSERKSNLWGSPSMMRSKTSSMAQVLHPIHRKCWWQQ